jgi:hypothetical protein
VPTSAGQFQAVAVGVEEVDAFEDGVVGGSNHFNARGFQPALVASSSAMLSTLKAMCCTHSGVLVSRPMGACSGQLEKRQHVALACIQEHVHVGVGRFGGGHLVFGNGQHEVHAQVLDVPLHGFFGVFAAVGDVVDALGCLMVCLLVAAQASSVFHIWPRRARRSRCGGRGTAWHFVVGAGHVKRHAVVEDDPVAVLGLHGGKRALVDGAGLQPGLFLHRLARWLYRSLK